MRIDDIEVEILINDRPAIEYSDNDFEQEPVEDEMSKYIEAVEGAKFAFRCTVHPSYEFAPAIDLLCFKFLVDGVRVMGKVVTKENISTGEPTTQMREGYITKLNGVASEEKFLFGKIKTCGRLRSCCTAILCMFLTMSSR